MKYYLAVYGCQMNISDAERISAVLEGDKTCLPAGRYKQTSNINEADLVAVVMCSIRQSAVDRIHGLVNKFKQIKKSNPNLKTILTGCVLKRDKKTFVEGFDFVIDIKDIAKLRGNELFAVPGPLARRGKGGYQQTEKSLLPSKKNLSASKKSLLPSVKTNYLDVTPKYSSKYSASVPIMTGCNNFCAYCVVPYVREREVSRSAKEIVSEIKKLVKNGCKEIWLLGQNVNSYKDDKINFPKLLELVNKIPGNFWIRFTSSHPKDFNDEVISAMASNKKISPYLNLPVQSGDDKILKSMNRHYTVKEYKDKIKKLRKKIPGVAISTDIIVGFPGETKKQFENTVKLFKDVKYDMAYINKYSKRSGTVAAKLKDSVSVEEKKRREKILTTVLKQIALEKNKKLVGKEAVVLINENRGDNYFGKDEQYKTVKVKSNKNILGKLIKVKITKASPFTLEAELIK